MRLHRIYSADKALWKNTHRIFSELKEEKFKSRKIDSGDVRYVNQNYMDELWEKISQNKTQSNFNSYTWDLQHNCLCLTHNIKARILQ